MLATAYIRRKRFEGQASLAAMGQAAKESQHPRVSADTLVAQMGGFG